MGADRPVVLFGLDGADPELVDRWIDDLPNFQRLRENGFFGELESIHPPITVPAWVCMISGWKPERFGIAEVMAPDFENYGFEPVDSSYFQGETLLDREGEVIAFGVPGTSPAYPVNGCMVAGLKFLEPDFYPESLEEEMKRETDIEVEYGEGEGWETPLEERVDAFTWLLENRSFDRAFGVVQLLDVAMHNTAGEDELKPYYERVDRQLGRMMDLCEENDWNLVVSSDHGSTHMEKSFFVNGWLREHGYVKYTDEKEDQARSPVYRLGKALLRFGALKPVVSRVADLVESHTGREWVHTSGTVMDNIDFDSSEAFSFMTSGMNFGAVWIHDSERWPRGTVPPGERKQKALEIKEGLEQEDLVQNVYFDEERLEKPMFPDLLVEGGEKVGVGPQTYPYVSHESEAAIHHKKGLVAGTGPDLGQGEVSARLIDVSPTIEAVSGSVTRCDGEPIEGVLADTDFSWRDREVDDIDF